MKETSKIIDINEKRLSDKHLVYEIRKANLYHGNGWLDDKNRNFFRGLLQDTIRWRFKRYK
ncbi:hypothetical protein V6B05_05420 [Lactococcus garvieae]|uniref:hypothetical protein n=1 Tax=Lactococcus garvieae TaxID=1363 RepID=UPI001F62054C|nr:hypothetical protein [Lactococcus garvieae]MCI3860785.1 hypothetical protein [Lactococcus garvieae]